MEGKLLELLLGFVGLLLTSMQASLVYLMRKTYLMTRDLHAGQPHCKAFTLEDAMSKMAEAIEQTSRQQLVISERLQSTLVAIQTLLDRQFAGVLERAKGEDHG